MNQSPGAVPGIAFPRVGDGNRSTYKDFTILVDMDTFGMDANTLAAALDDAGIETRRYYSPPVHRMRAYRAMAGSENQLPVTARISERVLTIPMWSEMREQDVERVVTAIRRIHDREMGASAAGKLDSSSRSPEIEPSIAPGSSS